MILASALPGMAMAVAPLPADARILSYHTVLTGAEAPVATDSQATGSARVTVDTERKKVWVDLAVDGMAMDMLADTLVDRPIGPIHFHKYSSSNHQGNDAVLIMPLPFGPSYQNTAKGFGVKLDNDDFSTASRLLGPGATLDTFVAAMNAGQVVLNIHTDAYPEGEISGTLRAD